VILTALPVEHAAVAARLSALRPERHPTGTVFHRGCFRGPDDGPLWDVCLAQVDEGNVSAAIHAERSMSFSPSVMCFLGVAGGVKDVRIGDVVTASRAYAYERGKEEDDAFRTRPVSWPVSYAHMQIAHVVARNPQWLAHLHRPKRWPDAFVGPIAAGEKVVASNRSATHSFLRNTFNDVLAVEMEGCGFLEAAYANHSMPALVIRGISDLLEGKAESERAGSQEQAAHNAAAFTFALLAALVGPLGIEGPEPTSTTEAMPHRSPWLSPKRRVAYRGGPPASVDEPDLSTLLQENERRLTSEELANATTHLTWLNQFLAGLRETLPEMPSDRLDRLEAAICVAVLEKMQSARGAAFASVYYEMHPRGKSLHAREASGFLSAEALPDLAVDRSSLPGTACVTGEAQHRQSSRGGQVLGMTDDGPDIGSIACSPVFGIRRGRKVPIAVLVIAADRARAIVLADRAFIGACAEILFVLGVLRGTPAVGATRGSEMAGGPTTTSS